MIPLICGLLLWGVGSRAQQPALTLVAERDSLGVGDTLEVRVLVDARGRMLTSASAVVALELGVFAPLAETPFAAGDFLPGQAYDNAAAVDGKELRLSYVAVSGTPEEGERPAATGQGELARFRVRALGPSAGTYLRLEGIGAHRSMYTEQDQPGVEQRFDLPGPLRLRVIGQTGLILPAAVPPPSAPALPAAPAQVSPPPNTPPRIAALAGLAVAAGGESYGPLLASFLSDAEDLVEALQVEVAGDAQVEGQIEEGRLVVRGLQAGRGWLTIRVADSQGAWASAQVEVLVRPVGQGPLLRALPKVALEVGGEKVLDLAAYVFDPDTPLAGLSWSLATEGGVEAGMAGTLLRLRGVAVGSARLSLQVTDPEGNAAMAALAAQVKEAPAAPVAPPADTVTAPERTAPDSSAETIPPDAEPPQEPTPPDSAVTAPGYTSAQSGNAAIAPQEEDQVRPSVNTEAPAAATGEEANVQPGANTEAPAQTGQGEPSRADTVQVNQAEAPAPEEVVTPEAGVMDTVQVDSAEALPATEAPAAETPPLTSPFAPIVEAPAAPVLPEAVPGTSAPQVGGTAPAGSLLAVEESVTYQLVAGRVDSGLVVHHWVRKGDAGQVRWSLRGGKRLEARLDEATGRLHLDARRARAGREVLFAEAALGEERRQVVLTIDVWAPRLALLPFPALELEAGQELALDLDSYVEGDFAPEELSWSAEAPDGAGVELDAAARVLRLWASGSFSLRLRVASPWGNQAEVLLEVRGITPLPPTPPDTDAPSVTASTFPEPVAEQPVSSNPQPEPQAPASPPASAAPADEHPPRLWLEGVVLGAEVEFRVRADEELRAAPSIRLNGQLLEVEAGGSGYRVRLAPRERQLQVQAEAADLAGNAAQARWALEVHQVQPGAARLSSPNGRWRVFFPQVRQPAWVLLREEGEDQYFDFDAARAGPAELVAAYPGTEAPAILRAEGEGWRALPTFVLAGGAGVFARSEGGGAFKLGGRAVAALPSQPLVYPNPFNAQAAIRYQVPAPGRVRVWVRDGQGRSVRQLVDQVQGPGVWTVPWDGRDGDGQGAASGVYFYEVQIAGQRWTGKLLLLR